MWATNFLWATKKTVSDKCSCERQNSDTRSNFKKCERQKKYGIQDRIAVSDKKNMWATKKIWDTRSNCRERQKNLVSDKKYMGYKIELPWATKKTCERQKKYGIQDRISMSDKKKTCERQKKELPWATKKHVSDKTVSDKKAVSDSSKQRVPRDLTLIPHAIEVILFASLHCVQSYIKTWKVCLFGPTEIIGILI